MCGFGLVYKQKERNKTRGSAMLIMKGKDCKYNASFQACPIFRLIENGQIEEWSSLVVEMCASVLINSTNTYCPNVFQTLQPGAHKTRYNIVFYKVCSSHFPGSGNTHVGTLSTLRAVCGKVFQAESRKLVLSVYSSASPYLAEYSHVLAHTQVEL